MTDIENFSSSIGWEYDRSAFQSFIVDLQAISNDFVSFSDLLTSEINKVNKAFHELGDEDVVLDIDPTELEDTKKEIKKTARSMEGFRDLIKETGRLSTSAGRIMSRSFRGVSSVIKNTTKAIVGATAGLTAWMQLSNAATVRNKSMADSVETSVEFLEAMDAELKPLGFDFDRTVDLVEEMNNKMGEAYGQFTRNEKILPSVSDAMRMLNLDFKEMLQLSPEEQFRKIMSAAKDLDDQQVAVSAVDMLFGGEANKILGYVRTLEGGFDNIIERRKQMNFLDAESRRGAENWSKSWTNLTGVLGSISRYAAGELGGTISTELNRIAYSFIDDQDRIKGVVRELNKWLMDVIPNIPMYLNEAWEGAKDLYGTFRPLFVDIKDFLVDSRSWSEILKDTANTVKTIAEAAKLVGNVILGVAKGVKYIVDLITSAISALVSVFEKFGTNKTVQNVLLAMQSYGLAQVGGPERGALAAKESGGFLGLADLSKVIQQAPQRAIEAQRGNTVNNTVNVQASPNMNTQELANEISTRLRTQSQQNFMGTL